MSGVFLTLMRMSAAGALTILAVLLARLVLRRFPRKYVCLLWLVVLFRLLCPVTLRAPTSVVPETVENGELVSAWTEKYAEETRVIRRGEPGYKDALAAGRTPVSGYPPAELTGKAETPSDPVEGEGTPSEPVSSGSTAHTTYHNYVVTAADGLSEPKRAGETWLPVLSWVWLAGAAAMLLWSVFKYLRLRLRLREAVRVEAGVYEAEGLAAPFVLGVLKPRIYLTWGMAEEGRGWVLLHERAHLRRLDPLWKLLGWLALCFHWFNPLCWLAFFLAVRDMEGACDEAVVKSLGGEERAAYSDLLLSLSAGRPLFAATPLGFGEGNVKQRIKSVLQWRKPKRWMAALAVLLLAAVVLLFAFGPRSLHRDFQGFEDTPDTWPSLRFFKQEWTEVCAGERGVWPVKDVKGFKKELTKLLEEGEWKLSGITDTTDFDANGRPVVNWGQYCPGKLRWTVDGKTWELYVGNIRIVLISGDFDQKDRMFWFGVAVKESDSPDRLYDVDEERMAALLALTEWGEPALSLEPEADLCFASLPWGCTMEEALAALPGAVRDGLTLTVTDAAVCGFRADAVLSFEEDEQGSFLNAVALTFKEETEQLTLRRFDRSALCAELSETWGERHENLPDLHGYNGSADAREMPERLWYWYTEDFSDEYQWMSGVTGWFERTGDPRTLYLDATGRNLAAGRQFDVSRNDLTVREVLSLHNLLEEQLPGGCEFSNGSEGSVILSVTDPSDQAWVKELVHCWPWVKVWRRMVIEDFDDTAPESSPLPHYPVEEGWTLLNSEEIEAAKEALAPIRYNEDGSMWVNPADPCFTSFYQDPRELNFSAFMRYFGIGDPTVTAATEEDFRALRDYGYDFWGSPWRHVEDIETPLTRIPASTVEAALRRYYDIGLDDLKTDYRTRYNYLPETDCFYSTTSDFGPGTFQPEWGERKNDLVRLWHSKTCLTCRKLEDRWIILSFWNENVGGQQSFEDPETLPSQQRDRRIAAEYRWVFVPEEVSYKSMAEGDDSVLTIPAGCRYRVEWEQITPEGEIWLRGELETRVDPAIQAVMLRPEDVIPWTEELSDRTMCPVYIPAGVTCYPRTFGYGDEGEKTLGECLTEENAAAHGYDLVGRITALEDGYALVGFAGGMEVWVKHDELKIGPPSGDEAPSELTRMLTEGRARALALGYPLETWGAELVWHRGREKAGESAYYAAYYPTATGEGTVCVLFTGDHEAGFTPSEALLIPPGAADWP